jgi:hypothetical protein
MVAIFLTKKTDTSAPNILTKKAWRIVYLAGKILACSQHFWPHASCSDPGHWLAAQPTACRAVPRLSSSAQGRPGSMPSNGDKFTSGRGHPTTGRFLPASTALLPCSASSPTRSRSTNMASVFNWRVNVAAARGLLFPARWPGAPAPADTPD